MELAVDRSAIINQNLSKLQQRSKQTLNKALNLKDECEVLVPVGELDVFQIGFAQS
jgi:hypothetical protein